MDIDYHQDVDHRKRRRNRTTQSCLNCHTSKRKCDRKRPCHRCIQLGLTGLCVYEVDDPSLRDDPTIDERTRLRNRIAELESLVRELRGKPHPRWADSNFRDGDPNEKWHSRAAKCNSSSKRRSRSPQADHHVSAPARDVTALLAPVKTEPTTDSQRMFSFSTSASPLRFSSFSERYSGSGSGLYGNSNSDEHGSFSLARSSSDGYSGAMYTLADGHRCDGQSGCSCIHNPNISASFGSLQQELRNTLDALRQCSHQHNCQVYQQLCELNNAINILDESETNLSSYGSNTPTDSDVMTPLSASGSFSASSPGVSPHEWSTLTGANYNSYFPGITAPDHNSYSGAQVIA